MKYLITGSSGVVGSYLVKELLRNHNPTQIVAISRKHRYFYDEHPGKDSAMLLECYANLRFDQTRLISQYQPDVIINCCGNGVANDYWNTWHDNVDTTYQLLKACCKIQVKFIHCSSIVVNHNPMTLYAAAKLSSEHLIQSFSQMYNNITGMVVRFPAVAGAGNKHGVVKAVVEKLLDKSQPKLNLFTNSKKPIVYAGQLAQTLVDISKRYGYHDSFTLCPVNNISVKDIVNIAFEKIGIRKTAVWQGTSWTGDFEEVAPVVSSYLMINSETAVELAIDDILEQDYEYARQD